jgi:hypothetical protein
VLISHISINHFALQFFLVCEALMGGTAYFLDALDRFKKDLPMIEDELKRKYLTRTSLMLDVHVIFLKLATIRFARLKVNRPKSVSCMNLFFIANPFKFSFILFF